jgi:hypothetical protein
MCFTVCGLQKIKNNNYKAKLHNYKNGRVIHFFINIVDNFFQLQKIICGKDLQKEKSCAIIPL